MLQIELHKQLREFRLDVGITLHEPGVIALFGRSGCGKSSTVNMIAGLLTPDGGRVQLHDEVLYDNTLRIDAAPEQRGMGYVFQEPRLFPHYTVRGNLEYGLRRAQPRNATLRFDHIVALLGLEALLTRRPFQLSGGEKQRVALGRALLSQPRLLLLDEPLASLDQARRREVLPYLELIRDELQLPMVYVSHQFDEVLQLANHVVLMEHGQVLAQGPLQDMGLQPALRQIIGAEAMGAIVEGNIVSIDSNGLAQVAVGSGRITIDANGLHPGQRVRLQLLARDLIVATQPPQGLSVRNVLQGVLVALTDDEPHAVLITVDIGGVQLVSRITRSAAEELALHRGMPVWLLVKAVTLRGRVYHGTVPA